MRELATAIGTMLVLEGALYALFPIPMKRAVIAMIQMPEGALRVSGLVCACAGFICVWLVRH